MESNRKNYTINLIGDSIRYSICAVPKKVFKQVESIKSKTGESYESIFFDLEFVDHYGFSHWSEFFAVSHSSGLLLKQKNSIEIRCGRKRLSKFSANDLTADGFLFDPFKKKIDSSPLPVFNESVGVVLIEKGIGRFGKFKFKSDNFSIENLCFFLNDNCLNSFSDDQWISRIEYRSTKVPRQFIDILTTRQQALVIG